MIVKSAKKLNLVPSAVIGKLFVACFAVIFIEDYSLIGNDLIIVQHTIDTGQDREPASWLKVDEKKKNIEVLNQPTRNDASQQIEEQLIVELYSK